jgi:hypothetical protein
MPYGANEHAACTMAPRSTRHAPCDGLTQRIALDGADGDGGVNNILHCCCCFVGIAEQGKWWKGPCVSKIVKTVRTDIKTKVQTNWADRL